MVVFVEQVGEEAGWRGGSAHLMDAPPVAPPNQFEDLAYGDTGASGKTGKLPKDRRIALLSRVVATEILPRLAVARRAAAREVDAVAAAKVTTDVDTVELVRLLLTSEDGGGLAFVETLVLRGATPEALYMGVLPASARRLGELWEEDRCDFSQVTIALGRLQQVARMLSPRFQAASVSQSDAVSLLLLPAPGEQHTFGLLILAEFFQRAGWRVAGGPKSSMADAAELARHQWFDVAGFSIGSERLLDSLAKTIRAVRRASRNRNIGVMVGGPLFQHRPELVALAGADAMALDAPGAVRLATGLLTMRAMAG